MEFSFCQYAIAVSLESPEPKLPSIQQIVDSLALSIRQGVDSLASSLTACLSYQKDSSKLVVNMEGTNTMSFDAAEQLLSAIAKVPACTKIVNCNASVFQEMEIAATMTGRYVWLQAEGTSVSPLLFGELTQEDKKVLAFLGQFISCPPNVIAASTGISLEVVDKILAKYLRLRVICLHTLGGEVLHVPPTDGEVLHILPFGGGVAAHD